MSSGSIKEDKERNIVINKTPKDPLESLLSKIVIPFSSVVAQKSSPNIYEGYEKILFRNRHPVYKAMMKLEFEEAARDFWFSKKEKKLDSY